ncbi:hypothetical protein GCM10023191_034990 [Actinoallomurus oryzae]|uniref:CU044_5270 family protein n=1 Tax=Actinoallomurus oryzae TaxID=502180 RepID=A0ABP8Q0G2_9ACTN
MDELRMVRDLYVPPEPAPPQEVAAARARLDAVMRTRRSRPRWALRGAALGAAAAGVALAVAISVTSPRPQMTRPAGPSARTVLLDAALSADRQPVTKGKYWYVDSRIRWLQKVKAGGYLIRSTAQSETWRAAGSSSPASAVGTTHFLGARPATPADEVAWREAGSPRTFLTVEGKRVSGKAGSVTADMRGSDLDMSSFAAQADLDELREIPETPDRLRAWLLALPQSPAGPHPGPTTLPAPGRPSPSPPGPPTRAQLDYWLFVQGVSLLLYSPITPKVRAAAFQMLAELPGVKLIGTVRDPDGRQGTAVAMDRIGPGDRPLRIQRRLVVDTKTGRALADEEVVLGPNTDYPGLPFGVVASTTTVRSAGWTNKAGWTRDH